jgi:hypothetical protein
MITTSIVLDGMRRISPEHQIPQHSHDETALGSDFP